MMKDGKSKFKVVEKPHQKLFPKNGQNGYYTSHSNIENYY